MPRNDADSDDMQDMAALTGGQVLTPEQQEALGLQGVLDLPGAGSAEEQGRKGRRRNGGGGGRGRGRGRGRRGKK
jgi:hypothetical protein